MALDEILQDLHVLETRLRDYEARYGVASEDFHELYQQGLLDDDGLEQTMEFTRWASAYTMKIEREQDFREQSRRFVASLRKKDSAGSLRLIPNPELHKV